MNCCQAVCPSCPSPALTLPLTPLLLSLFPSLPHSSPSLPLPSSSGFTLHPIRPQVAGAEHVLAGARAGGSLPVAAAAGGRGLLAPGPHPGLDLPLLQQLSLPPVFSAAPKTELVLRSPVPGEFPGRSWEIRNGAQGLGWGLGQQRSQGGQGAPSSLSPSFFCSAVETFPTSCLSSLSLLWGPFPACLAHISAPQRQGCTEPGPLASPVCMVALRPPQGCCPGSALHVAPFLCLFTLGHSFLTGNSYHFPIPTYRRKAPTLSHSQDPFL